MNLNIHEVLLFHRAIVSLVPNTINSVFDVGTRLGLSTIFHKKQTTLGVFFSCNFFQCSGISIYYQCNATYKNVHVFKIRVKEVLSPGKDRSKSL